MEFRIAQTLNVPERVIALTFVSLGTSLPELATALAAIIKGHGAISLGNIIGANVMNLSVVVGVSSTITPHHNTGGHISNRFLLYADTHDRSHGSDTFTG